jgi:hypothetical protein
MPEHSAAFGTEVLTVRRALVVTANVMHRKSCLGFGDPAACVAILEDCNLFRPSPVFYKR